MAYETPSKNEGYGFFGTLECRTHGRIEAWDAMLEEIARLTGYQAENARIILDSSIGRHMADMINDLMRRGSALPQAAAIVAERHMKMKVSAADLRSYGRGMAIGKPFLKEICAACIHWEA